MNEQASQSERPRPDERFAGPQHQYDLNVVATRIRQEVHPGVAGHRQESLCKRGPTTIALFLFGSQTRLAPHRTKGTVIIQVLKGRMSVMAEGQKHDLSSGGLLVLAASVQHEVLALEESEMLLTVHLDAAAASSM